MRRIVPIALLVLGGFAAPAGAWSNGQHQTVCELAFQLLSPAGQDFVKQVRREARDAGLASAGSTFAQSCTWPDEVRKDQHSSEVAEHLSTYEYHFVNVRERFGSFDRARDCAAWDCAPIAIIRYATYLSREPSGNREKQRREMALRFVGHYVGDLHQPLHAGHEDDAGGNFIDVRWRNTTGTLSLHSAWDSRIPREAGIVGLQNAPALLAELNALDISGWRTMDPWQWAADSYEIAKDAAYRLPNGDEVVDGTRLDDAYVAKAAPIAKEQIFKAAVRLAAIIEAAAGGSTPFPGP